jgi:Mediator complex subunit 23.
MSVTAGGPTKASLMNLKCMLCQMLASCISKCEKTRCYAYCLELVYRILERIGARALSAHLRKFCDYLVFEFANSGGGQHVNKCVDALNDMIWQYNIVTIDRLVLCLVSIPDLQLCILSEYHLPFMM